MYGMGPRGSPLVAGHTALHRELEKQLAKLKCTEECLLFPSGFAANMAVITALASDKDVHVYSDELNHASIIDGTRLAVRDPERRHVYRHKDMKHLDELLSSAPSGARKLVVTDTVFSMDGDVAPLTEMARLREKHDFLFVVDEAHATLLYGPTVGSVHC
jgi:8-amino-7-oxononanoate synthase